MTALLERPAPQRRNLRMTPRRRRRHTYGITDPGTYSNVPAWWSRERWRSECFADLHTPAVADLRRSVGTRGPVSIRACWALAKALSACADNDTGRNAMPGNAALTTKLADGDQLDLTDPAVLAQLRAATGFGETTLQKASQVLAARGWIVLIRAGKSWLTLDERLELHAADSSARQRRNVWACTVPAHVRTNNAQRAAQGQQPAPESAPDGPPQAGPVDNSGPGEPHDLGGCDLPTTLRVKRVGSVTGNNYFKPEQASRTGASRRAPGKTGYGNRTYRTDGRVVRLAKDLRTRIPWLRTVPHQRLMPALHRFAVADWTARDVQTHLDRLLAQRGWSVPGSPAQTERDHTGRVHHSPATTMRSPWGYLAYLLRHLDPADVAIERAYAADLAAIARYERLLITGVSCPHGQPAGDVPSPTRGILACPLCRRARSTGTGPQPHGH